MLLDFSRCRLTPFAHQREDVAAMIANPWFFITSEMRTGKTKIVIDAAQFMFIDGTIERVIVVAPAPVVVVRPGRVCPYGTVWRYGRCRAY